MIPKEAIRAVSEAARKHSTDTRYQPSVFRIVSTCASCGVVGHEHEAEVALEAAAPFLRAQALEDAADGWSDWDALQAPEDWLRARAATERGQG